jgi:dGTPase
MEMREKLEQLERQTLAPYAAFSSASRGREHVCAPCRMRTEFQRDRDRIVHCAAFRKLEFKTQVYVIHEGDYYRTRLTHTMEVAQIARTMARSLRLNSDLTEAVALAHDMGHTPFGHSGETALHRLMAGHGGFEHNRQGLRIVECLEQRYREFPGLNLTWEVREGVAKHSTSYDAPSLDRFDPMLAPTLEAQLVDAADEIAFNHHDLDDALKLGILSRHDLEEVPWLAEICREVGAGGLSSEREFDQYDRCRLIGALIDAAVRDALEQTERNIREVGIRTLEEVRQYGKRLVDFSEETSGRNRVLRSFLMRHVYRHPNVMAMTSKAERFIESLFQVYCHTPQMLPARYQTLGETEGLERAVADYISGMTDRYCLEEYKRMFLP